MALFTVWRSPPATPDSGPSCTLIRGEGPPRGADGTLLDPDATCLHRFEATSLDEAMRHYHELMGWEPYRPMLDADGRPYPSDSAPLEG